MSLPVEFMDEFCGSPLGELNFLFGAQDEYELSIAASEGEFLTSDVED